MYLVLSDNQKKQDLGTISPPNIASSKQDAQPMQQMTLSNQHFVPSKTCVLAARRSEPLAMGRPASLLLSGVAWDYTKDEGRRRISTAEVDVSSSRPRILPQSLGGRPWTSLRENRRHVFQFDYCPTHTARVDASRRAPKREDRLERAGSCSGRFQRSAGCITSSNGFKMNYSVPQLEERSLLGAGWTRSSGSKGALKKGPSLSMKSWQLRARQVP